MTHYLLLTICVIPIDFLEILFLNLILFLKEQGVIESVPNKGYYIANETRKVLLVLDTFKAYKEVVYHSFVNNLPDNIITDVQFHHYNIDNFKTILNNSKG